MIVSMLSRRLVLGSLLALLPWLVPTASAGTLQEDYQGFYRGVDSATGREFLARVEMGRPEGLPETIMVTLFQPDGRFRVYGGSLERGGLYVPFGTLYEAKDAQSGYLILASPRLLYAPGGGFNQDLLTLDSGCQVNFEFGEPGRMTYQCGDRRNGSHSGGVLIRRRS